MLRSVALKMLHDQWRTVLAGTVLAGLLAAFYLALYPSIGGVDQMTKLLEAMPPELRAMFAAEGADIGSPAGYLNMELFSFMLPLIVLAVTVTGGAAATAGEEERGTLELLLANPVHRSRIVLEKALGTGFLSAVLCGGVWVALAIAAPVFDVELAVDRVAAGLVSLWLLGGVLGAAALLVGALTGSRLASISIGLAVAVVGFFVSALAPLADVLEPWRPLSPHYHYIGYDPLTNGLDLEHAAVLLGVAVVLTLLAALAFERRDLRA